MRFFPIAAVAATVAGATLLGASLGGMSHVDHELARATQPAPAVQFDQVVYHGDRSDCPRGARRTARHRAQRPEL